MVRNGRDSVEELRLRLDEAEQTIEALRNGDVDAVVVAGQGGDRVYTLEGADSPYRNIVQTMNSGAVTIDGQGDILYCNGAFSKMTGFPLEKLIGSSFVRLVVPGHEAPLLKFLRRAREAGKATKEIAIRRRRGRLFVHLSASVHPEGETMSTCLVITDISRRRRAEDSLRKAHDDLERRVVQRTRELTAANEALRNEIADRRRAEEALRTSEKEARSRQAELEAVYRSAPIGLCVFDRNLRWVRVNDQIAEINGMSPDAHIGRTPREVAPDVAGQAEAALRKILHTGEPLEFEMKGTAAGQPGVVRYWNERWVPIKDDLGNVTGISVAAEEITQRKRMEEDLRKSRDELERRVRERTEELVAANATLNEQIREKERIEEQLRQAQKMEALGTLAGGIAHDFNNMLAVIIGNSELALDDLDDNDATRTHLEQIFKASYRARDLVKQILTFSRKTERQRQPMKLTPLVKETFQLLRGTLPTSIRIELDLQARQDSILADASQMQQVLVNLSTNAAHAMRPKGGTLTIGLSNVTYHSPEFLPDGDMSPGAYLRLAVADNGVGMEEGIRNKAFDPFFTTKEVGQGTGMGLAVVYGIVKSHGGAITVESRPGKGSTFTLFLPLAEQQAGEEQKERTAPRGGRERLLLVDDEPLVVETVSRILARLGYDVTSAPGGPQALELFLSDPRRFDLVITDQAMPDLSGIALAEKMLEVREDTPIVLLTGHSEAATPEKVKAAGIRELVMKPIDKREVAEIVRRVLDERKEKGRPRQTVLSR